MSPAAVPNTDLPLPHAHDAPPAVATTLDAGWAGPLRGHAAIAAIAAIVLHLLLGLATWWAGPTPGGGSASTPPGGQGDVVYARLPPRAAAAPDPSTVATAAATPVRTPPPPMAAPDPAAERPAGASPDVAAAATPGAAEASAERAAPSPGTALDSEVAQALPPATSGAPPRYRTQVPPSAQLRYRLLRGGFSGLAMLDWRFEAGSGYTLSLGPGAAAGAGRGERWAWVSTGAFDTHGLAPRRYADQIAGRERRSVNFQREAGLVSWSASERQQPLPAGLQDRVSWLVQLAAMLNAEPALRQPGQTLELWVAGLRGEVVAWRLEVRGAVTLALADGGQLDALHVVHEPNRPWAPRIELWLDPQQGHLPARLSFGARPPLEPLDLLREDLAASPPGRGP